MTRSFTIITALLCSVSFIPLADATPGQFANAAPLTDWHVAPVLASGRNQAPYCALAASYPQAGVIITHARSRNGSGTIAFDFRQADFEPRQFYGLDVAFDNTVQQFAAEARNDHMLVIDLRSDHPLYAALDAGHNFDVSVQQGGPHVTIAGNSRPFFQLNYCVQALNTAPPAQVAPEALRTSQPGFALQQPAPRASAAAPVRYNPASAVATTGETVSYRTAIHKQNAAPPKQANNYAPVAQPALSPMPAIPVPRISAEAINPLPRPVSNRFVSAQVTQTTTQDGDQTRSDLSNMLNQARSASGTTAPVRQKLNGISSNDIVTSPAASAAVTRAKTARDALMYDDADKADTYVAPRLSEQDKTIETNAVPAAKTPARPMPATPLANPVPAPVAPVAAAAKPAAPALPPALALDDTPTAAMADTMTTPAPATPAQRMRDSLSAIKEDKPVAVAKPAAPAKTGIISDETRMVNAKDYLAGKPGTAVPAAAAPVKPVTPPVAAPIATTVTAEKPVAKPVAAPAVAPQAKTLANSPLPNLLSADKRAALLMDTPTTATSNPILNPKAAVAVAAPAAPVKTVTSPVPVAAPPAAMPAPVAPPVPAVMPAAPLAAPAPATKSPALRPADVFAKAEAKTEPKAIANPTAKIAPAPALPPMVEETVLDHNVRGPMRPASEAVNVGFIEDNDAMDAPRAAAPVANAAPLAVPAAMLAPKPVVPVRFAPPATTATTPWQSKTVAARGDVDGYCVLQNRFANQQSLFISRATDGSATLGLDYGMDLLQVDRDYKATVQTDNGFVEDFIAHADEPNLLVIRMGRKDSFFQALAGSKDLHIEISGGASTFDVTGIKGQLGSLNQCLASQGAESVNTAPPVAASAGVEPGEDLPAPAPAAAPTAPAAPVASLSAGDVNATLQQAGIKATVRGKGNGYTWGGAMDVAQGEINEQRFRAGKADLLEAAMRDLDSRESMCGNPSFTSEIGAPEQKGDNEIVSAETSCTRNDQTSVAALLYQRIGQIFRVWSQTGPQGAREQLLRQRDRLAQNLPQK